MDTAFFVLSKLIGLTLQVETWLALGLMLSLIAGRLTRTRVAQWSCGISLVGILAIGIFPVGDVLLFPLEAEYPPRLAAAQIDGIVVLGGVEDQMATDTWGDPQLNEAAERLTAAAALAIAHPNAQLVFSGGRGRLRSAFSERSAIPSVAIDFFVSLGIDKYRITWEDRSRNTSENARFSYQLAAPADDETWVLVTSAFHMGRAIASFEAAGWAMIVPYPVDYRTGGFSDRIGWNFGKNLEILNIAIKERVGRLAYRLMGR